MANFEEIIYKHFKDEKVIYPIISDMQKQLEGDMYLSYRNMGDKVALYLGNDNGDLCILVTRSAEKLERVLLAFIS